jgi:glutathione S-transferase
MITLFGSGPNFGLPDASPFVTKVETLLLMSKLPFEKAQMSFSKAPKGKIPYIDDGGELLGDSTFIRWHLENKYKIDFDEALTAEQRAIAWAFEKMAEDNLYWVSVHSRWMDEANFERGPQVFFKAAPAVIRPFVIAMVRRKVRNSLHGHGMGRHSANEIAALGARSLEAFAGYLGDKPFFMGAEPTGADATIFAFVISAMCPLFKSPLQEAAAGHGNLRRYVGRMTARFYPGFEEIAGCKATA